MTALISQLTPTTPQGADLIEVERQGDGSYQITVQGIVDLVPPSSGATWGSVTGTLSNQTDLQSALDLKANSADVYTQAQTDSLLNAKANSADVYTQAQVDSLLNAKADQATTYTKAEVDAAIAAAVASYLPLTGGTLTGALTVQGNIVTTGAVQADGDVIGIFGQ